MSEVRGQLLFRRCRGDNFANVDVGIGIIETHPATFPAFRNQDILVDLACKRQHDAFSIGLIPKFRSANAECALDDIGRLVTSLQYPMGMGGGTSGGSLFIRTTKIPSPRKLSVHLVAFVVQAIGEEIDRQTIYEITGDHQSLAISPTTQKIPFEPNGMALCQVHKSPVWGWDEEPWAPVSTLRLDMLDILTELDALQYLDDPTAAQLARMAELRSKLTWDPTQSARKDEDFLKFRQKMMEAGFVKDWAGSTTQSQDAAFSNHAKKVIRDLLAA